MHLDDIKDLDTFREHFWDKVDRSSTQPAECWLWQGGIARTYGHVSVPLATGGRKGSTAHRIAYLLEHEEIGDGIEITHTDFCTHHRCCRPSHLAIRITDRSIRKRRPKERFVPLSISDLENRAECAERFWACVDTTSDGCWEWKGPRNKGGYGGIRIKTHGRRPRIYGTNRVAYMFEHGSVSSTEVIRHTCDNPPCCRPSHLIAGSPADNTHDMINRQRNPFIGVSIRGTKSFHAKLSEADVSVIRGRYDAGERIGILANDYGMSTTAIHLIVNRKTWKHIA